MRIRNEQLEVLRKARLEHAREAQIKSLRERGLKADKDPKNSDILVEDKAGGTARVAAGPGVVSVTSGEGRTIRAESNSRGRLGQLIDPAGFPVSFDHDDRGRLVAVRRGEHSSFQFEPDDKGNLAAIIFPDKTATQFAYNPAGQLSTLTDRNGSKARYSYSETGLLTQVTDPGGNATRFEYGEWDSPSEIIYADGNRHEFEYDGEGRISEMVENGNHHARFNFDQSSGKYEIDYSDGTRSRFLFDKERVVEAVNETCTVKIGYDEKGNILSEETDGIVVRYVRNEVGALIGIITPDGEKISFERDKEHRVRRITDWAGGQYEFSYEASGVLAGIEYPNGCSMTMLSTPLGLPESLSLMSSTTGEVIASCRWSYDSRDRMAKMERKGEGRVYRYDNEGRLLAVVSSRAENSERYELDANGNRIKDQAGACQFNGQNQLVRRGEQAFNYDGLGNMTAGYCPKGEAVYKYNGRSQLVSVETSTGLTRYGYDGFGRRVVKESGGRVTRYVWAGQQLLSEITTEGGKKTRRDYLMFAERPFPLAMREEGKVYYIHPGRLAEPIAMTDRRGEAVWKADYTAFGQARISVEKVTQPWRLAGQYHDDETGLHYALARYYNAELGRYLTPDPLRVFGGSLNFYTYCDGDPINRYDPTGEFIIPAILIGMAIGAAIGAGIEWYRQKKAIDAGEQQGYNGWRIAGAAAIGGVVGAIGGGVGALVEGAFAASATATLAGAAGVGALSGAASSVAEQCAEAALTGKWPSASEFALNTVIGAGIGAVTGGIGGLFARRARKAASEISQEVLEGAVKAGKEVQKKASKQGARQVGSEFSTGPADEAYDAIRASTTDVEAIARNTGIKPSNIQKVKNHLFHDEHLLDRYVDQGIPAEKARFDSDMAIANAWKRLEEGTFTKADMQLLKHETAEAWYMKKNGPSYTNAHEAAQKRYPAPKLEEE